MKKALPASVFTIILLAVVSASFAGPEKENKGRLKRKNPFALSEKMIEKIERKRAKKNPAGRKPAEKVKTRRQPVRLAGLLASGEKVLVTFKSGEAYFHVLPGENFTDGNGVTWTLKQAAKVQLILVGSNGRELFFQPVFK